MEGVRFLYEVIPQFRSYTTDQRVAILNETGNNTAKSLIQNRREYEIIVGFLEDPNTKRMLFDSRQAMVFSELAPPPENIQRKLHLPFEQFYLEFSEPLHRPNTEPGYNDVCWAFGVMEKAARYTWGSMSGDLAQVTMFGKAITSTGRITYVDRSWKVDLANGMAFTSKAVLTSVDPAIYFPPETREGSYWPIGLRVDENLNVTTPDEHGEITWIERAILDDTALLSWCLAYIMAKSIVIVEERLPRHERRRLQHEGKHPEPWHVVKVDPKIYVGGRPGEPTGMTHSYRYDVIGHLRFARHHTMHRPGFGVCPGNGCLQENIEWVSPHQRGLVNSVYIPKTYKVDKGRTIAEPMQNYFDQEGRNANHD